MKTVDFSGLVAVPTTLVGGVVMSAVLDADAVFGVQELVMSNFAVSEAEALEIANFLVRFSGRSEKVFSYEARVRFGSCDSAVREAVASCWTGLCSFELCGAVSF